jgi:hypothetical protein
LLAVPVFNVPSRVDKYDIQPKTLSGFFYDNQILGNKPNNIHQSLSASSNDSLKCGTYLPIEKQLGKTVKDGSALIILEADAPAIFHNHDFLITCVAFGHGANKK